MSNTSAVGDDEWKWRLYDDGYEQTAFDVATHVIPMTVTVLSIIGCYVIIRECLSDLRTNSSHSSRRGGSAVQKQFISMSVAYLMFHLVRVLGPIPAPREYDVWGTSGTVATCEMAGFLGQLGLFSASILFTILTWLYTLIVCYNKSDGFLNKTFLWSNAITWITSIVLASVGIPLGVYNFNGQVCWFASFPQGCEESGICIRGGESAGKFATVYHIFYWPCMATVAFFFNRVYRSVRSIEDRAVRYAGGSATSFRNWGCGVSESFRRIISRRKLDLGEATESMNGGTGVDSASDANGSFRPSSRRRVGIGAASTASRNPGSGTPRPSSTGRLEIGAIHDRTDPATSQNSGIATSGSFRNLSKRMIEARVKPDRTSRATGRNSGSSVNWSFWTSSRRVLEALDSTVEAPVVNRAKSKAVGFQALLMIGSYVATMILSGANRIAIVYVGKIYWLNMMANIMLSLPGFFNLVIFVQPRKEMATPEGRLVRKLIYSCKQIRRQKDPMRATTALSGPSGSVKAGEERAPACDSAISEADNDSFAGRALVASSNELQPEDSAVASVDDSATPNSEAVQSICDNFDSSSLQTPESSTDQTVSHI